MGLRMMVSRAIVIVNERRPKNCRPGPTGRILPFWRLGEAATGARPAYG